jgi:hypothetical protein
MFLKTIFRHSHFDINQGGSTTNSWRIGCVMNQCCMTKPTKSWIESWLNLDVKRAISWIYIYIIYPSWKHVSIFFVITRTFSFVFLSFEYPWAIHGCHGLRVRRFESDFKLEQVRTGYHGSIEMVPSLRNIFSLCCFFSSGVPQVFWGK